MAWALAIGIAAVSIYDSTLPTIPSPIPPFFSFSDKIMHFGGYWLLALAALQGVFPGGRGVSWRGLVLVFLAILALQCGNEFIQYATSIDREPQFQRHAEVLDVLSGALGVAAANLLFLWARNVLYKA